MKKVVGIDPGLAGTGVGVVSGLDLKVSAYSFGAISTSAQDTTACRLNHIFSQLTDFFKTQKPDLVVVEDIYSLEKYPGSGIILGKVVGVIQVAAHRAGVNVEEIPVREVKNIVSGNGSADKHQIERAVRNYLNHPEAIRPFHASDALGLALAGFFRYCKIL